MPLRKRLGQIDLFSRRVRAADYARSASEFQLSCSVADLLRRSSTPGWQWTHFPAGETRTKSAGERLKRMGLQPGWPDYILLPPTGDPAWFAGVRFLELKRGKGGRVSEAQEVFQGWCAANGYAWELAKDLIEAIGILRRWGAIRVSL